MVKDLNAGNGKGRVGGGGGEGVGVDPVCKLCNKHQNH